jgi:hypothetical protein
MDRLPKSHGPILAGGCQPPAVLVRGHALGASSVSLERERSTARQVPDPYSPIPVGRGQPAAAGAEGDADGFTTGFRGTMGLEGTQLLATAPVPDSHGAVRMRLSGRSATEPVLREELSPKAESDRPQKKSRRARSGQREGRNNNRGTSQREGYAERSQPSSEF